jgi:hypothetical protein
MNTDDPFDRLRAQLRHAAEQQANTADLPAADTQSTPSAHGPTHPRARHLARPKAWRRGRLPLLVAATTLTLAGGALAANALLGSGDPVPAITSKRYAFGTVLPGTNRVIDVGARDPGGGPGWAILLYGVGVPERTLPNGDPGPVRTVVCATVGRTQAGKIGVVGRDGAFRNDGRFHELVPESRPSVACGGGSEGRLGFNLDGPPVPASGYTGPVGAKGVGGCKEHVGNVATQSKQMRRRLRDLPVCRAAGLRIVKYGFAGPRATKVTFSNDKFTRTATPDPKQNGAYIFVVLPKVAGPKPAVLTTTYDTGLVCRTSIGRSPTDPRCLNPPGLQQTAPANG